MSGQGGNMSRWCTGEGGESDDDEVDIGDNRIARDCGVSDSGERGVS